MRIVAVNGKKVFCGMRNKIYMKSMALNTHAV
jgi:hypothetical protein